MMIFNEVCSSMNLKYTKDQYMQYGYTESSPIRGLVIEVHVVSLALSSPCYQ